VSTAILGAKNVINRQLGVDAARKTVITATFHPRTGWSKVKGEKKVGLFALLSMRAQGVSYITAASDSRRADFSLTELFA
jgi:hypothetical protein